MFTSYWICHVMYSMNVYCAMMMKEEVVEVQDFSYDSAPQPIALLARAGESMEYQCCSEGLKRK